MTRIEITADAANPAVIHTGDTLRFTAIAYDGNNVPVLHPTGRDEALRLRLGLGRKGNRVASGSVARALSPWSPCPWIKRVGCLWNCKWTVSQRTVFLCSCECRPWMVRSALWRPFT